MKTFIFALIAVNIFSSLACATASTGDTRRQDALRRCNARGGTLVEHKRTLGGRATYYADHFNGKTMACGGTFWQRNKTAAIKIEHRGLVPCGTIVTVTRTDKAGPNGEPLQITLPVTDVGPLATGRVIDLSKSAAAKLEYGVGRHGDPPVTVEWTAYSCR